MKFCQAITELRGGPQLSDETAALANNLSSAWWDPEQRTRLSHAQKLRDNKQVWFSASKFAVVCYKAVENEYRKYRTVLQKYLLLTEPMGLCFWQSMKIPTKPHPNVRTGICLFVSQTVRSWKHYFQVPCLKPLKLLDSTCWVRVWMVWGKTSALSASWAQLWISDTPHPHPHTWRIDVTIHWRRRN